MRRAGFGVETKIGVLIEVVIHRCGPIRRALQVAVQLGELPLLFEGEKFHVAEEVVAYHAFECPRVAGQRVGVLDTVGVLADLLFAERGVWVTHHHPLVDERGIHLANELSQPHEDVAELLGAVGLRN